MRVNRLHATEQHQTRKFCLPCASWHLWPTNLPIRLDFNSFAFFLLLFLLPIWPCSTQPALGRAFLLFASILSLAEKALHRQGKKRTSTTGISNKQSSSLDQEVAIQAENRRIWETLLSVRDWKRKEPNPFQRIHLPGRWLMKGRWSSKGQTWVTKNCLAFDHKTGRVKTHPCAEHGTVLYLQISWAGGEGMGSSFAQQFKCIVFLTAKKLQELICLKRLLNIILILIIQFSASQEPFHL